MKIEYGKYEGAQTVALTNSCGMSVKLCALGAGIMSIKVPDKDGVSREVTRLSDKGYGREYHGLTIGRTSGRIAHATFSIGNSTATLEKNNHGEDNLHGGIDGLHGKLFKLEAKSGDGYGEAVFTYHSPDGEGGYFGNVDVTITYRVYENTNKLTVTFDALPDRTTLVNLTNHAYFNMSGDLREPVTEQTVYVNASRVSVLNERLIIERIADVSPQFDFRHPHKMGDYIQDQDVQRYTHGYDHQFFLDGRGTDKLACSLYSALSGIKMEVRTTYPCVVIFGDNFGGYRSTCFECQYDPDGIHHDPEDCGVCSPEKPYSETTEFTFEVCE